MPDLRAPALEAIRAAHDRIRGFVLRPPLLPLPAGPDGTRIFLKPENLQVIGSFKVRGSGNAMARLTPAELAEGVYTASAGNMAQGVAWNARRLGISCGVVVPEHAPAAKLEAIERLGGAITKVSFDEWWRVMITHRREGMRGRFIHPVSDVDVIAGNGTIGIEIAEDLPEVDTVIVPFGGGGLSCGIASALRALSPRTRVLAAEVETAAPLAASLAAGAPVAIDHRPSFVDGIGGKSVLEEMWPLASTLLAGSVVVSLEETAAAIRLLAARTRLVAEGAGASSVAAALSGRAGGGTIVCVVSGGNIDPSKLATILKGEMP
ncbi:MAG TPA: pyridoxal-phosphate dependent enzyme [Candidatus Eisenbacteria bacterium]|nr:pyridoxal-phosphate dependent enzyme [Candidatus Eisenbacteria bacterium]